MLKSFSLFILSIHLQRYTEDLKSKIKGYVQSRNKRIRNYIVQEIYSGYASSYDGSPILCTHLFLLKSTEHYRIHISTNCSTDIRYGVCLLMVLLLRSRPIKVGHDDEFGLLTQCLSVAKQPLHHCFVCTFACHNNAFISIKLIHHVFLIDILSRIS